jgi:CheY-like chemotaxis protein
MNLSYRILWIEDETEFIDSFDVDALQSYVEEQGFDLELIFRTKPDEIRQDVDGTKFDLLIIDYNIADDDLHGSDVIRQVRDKNCLTEVIFYSQNGVATLRKIAAEKELEGVFYSGRPTEQLLRKIKDVFNLTVRKVVDVDNMRGIVMAGVADIDHLVTDLIRAVHASVDERRQITLRKRLLEKMKPVVNHLGKLLKEPDHPNIAEIEKLVKAVVALEPSDFETLVQARHFDSSRRVDMAVSLCKEEDKLKPHKEAIASIRYLLQWRNALAHQKFQRLDDSGFPVFEPIEGKEESFNDSRTRELRQALRKRREMLKAVLAMLAAK